MTVFIQLNECLRIQFLKHLIKFEANKNNGGNYIFLGWSKLK